MIIQKHIEEANKLFDKYHMIGVFLQGSQNYKINLPTSDVDTKVLITPTFEDVALNKKPLSGTHILDNKEHLDYKDIRLYIDTFRKQNINFIEILFTDYFYVNPMYANPWNLLLENREKIARYNPWRALKAMFGMAHRNNDLIFHETEDTKHYFDTFGYNTKALSNFVRIVDFIERYIYGESYEKCLIPIEPKGLIQIKQGFIPEREVLFYKSLTEKKLRSCEEQLDYFFVDRYNEKTEEILIEAQKSFMEIALKHDLEV